VGDESACYTGGVVNVKQAARQAGVSPATIRRYISSGKLQARRRGGRYEIAEEELVKAFPQLQASQQENELPSDPQQVEHFKPDQLRELVRELMLQLHEQEKQLEASRDREMVLEIRLAAVQATLTANQETLDAERERFELEQTRLRASLRPRPALSWWQRLWR